MGIIFLRDGQPYVLEASATVRYTRLRDWISRGVNGSYVVKRLATRMTPPQAESLRRSAKSLAGRPYDLSFEWSDSRMYCSELVWKIYDRGLGIKLGDLQRLGDFDLSSPAVKAKMQERYGAQIPLDEPVISPATVFASPLLVEIARAGS